MALEAIFVNAINRAEAQSKQYGGTTTKGAAALSAANDRPAKRTVGAVMFADGDIIEIPQLPTVNPETADCWLSKPLSNGGDPVLSVLVKCTGKNGVVSVKEFFIGSLFKSAENAETNVFEETTGDARNLVEGKGTEMEQWAAIAGKKLQFSNPKKFKTVRRDFSGRRPDRLGNTTVWTINIVG